MVIDKALLHATLDRYLVELSRQGWRVVSRSDTTAQVSRKRKVSPLGIPLLVLLPLAISFLYREWVIIAFIGLVMVLLAYATAKTELRYITEDEVARLVPDR